MEAPPSADRQLCLTYPEVQALPQAQHRRLKQHTDRVLLASDARAVRLASVDGQHPPSQPHCARQPKQREGDLYVCSSTTPLRACGGA